MTATFARFQSQRAILFGGYLCTHPVWHVLKVSIAEGDSFWGLRKFRTGTRPTISFNRRGRFFLGATRAAGMPHDQRESFNRRGRFFLGATYTIGADTSEGDPFQSQRAILFGGYKRSSALISLAIGGFQSQRAILFGGYLNFRK